MQPWEDAAVPDSDTVEARRRSEARYRSLVDASAADVWVTTVQGRLLTDLPRWRATTRQGAEEVVGDGWLQAVHPGDRDRVAEVWRAATTATGVYEVEHRIVPVRGAVGPDDVRTLSVRGVPVRDASGQAVEYVGVTVDVTERRRDDDLREELARCCARAGRCCGGWGLGHLADAAVLAVSELVTNAVVHARTGARLGLVHAGGRLRITVEDDVGDCDLRPREVDEHATHGRGLALVEAVSDRWGVEQGPDGGKAIWLELDA